jgi:hypothetical protein
MKPCRSASSLLPLLAVSLLLLLASVALLGRAPDGLHATLAGVQVLLVAVACWLRRAGAAQ